MATNSLSKVAIGAFIERGKFAVSVAMACIGSTVVGGLVLLTTTALMGP